MHQVPGIARCRRRGGGGVLRRRRTSPVAAAKRLRKADQGILRVYTTVHAWPTSAPRTCRGQGSVSSKQQVVHDRWRRGHERGRDRDRSVVCGGGCARLWMRARLATHLSTSIMSIIEHQHHCTCMSTSQAPRQPLLAARLACRTRLLATTSERATLRSPSRVPGA